MQDKCKPLDEKHLCYETNLIDYHNIPRSSGWIPRSNYGRAMQVGKKYPRGSGCSVPDVVKQKSAFNYTWFSNNKGFCLEIKSCHPLIHI